MDAVVVDTDVLSYTFKRDTRHVLYRSFGKPNAVHLLYDACGSRILGRITKLADTAAHGYGCSSATIRSS